MPLYDYHCRACDATRRDEWYHLASDAPRSLVCTCGESMVRLIGIPLMWPQGHSGAVVPGKEVFAGTPLEGTDGRNPYAEPGEPGYKEPKLSFDMGA
jgi:hypothetical protein